MTFRRRYYPCITSMTETAPGRFVAVHEHRGAYKIEGGRALGGTPRDWFLSGAVVGQNMPCNSVADALRLIQGL